MCRTSRIGEVGGSFLLAYRHIAAHWRAIILLLILVLASLLIIQGEFFSLLALALILIFIVSQLFWISRITGIRAATHL